MHPVIELIGSPLESWETTPAGTAHLLHTYFMLVCYGIRRSLGFIERRKK